MADLRGQKALWMDPIGEWLNSQFQSHIRLNGAKRAIPQVTQILRQRYKFLKAQFGLPGTFTFTVSLAAENELKVTPGDEYSHNVLMVMRHVDLLRKP